MSFEVGRLSAALTLDGVQDFHRGLDDAGRKLTDTGQRGASFGTAVAAGVRTAAGATTGLVTAATAYLTILTKSGIAYNSLQQNSRAALSVLLGGTEKANAQMSKLDEFARNSPFSKSVFIQAQQQLIGFGMEAGKVIPTLDAIQQSMAAMGRGNEDISEVVRVLAQVTSTGKFTGETLQQLGVRGIDAATLIGERMGKTGAEIREAITAGTIGGEVALDHLVDAMGAKFGGAADNVKQQWSGAVDRIKAANRDLGAVIAEPFVSAQGGGMAVTWGNQVANVLRAIEKQAIPVMGILTQRGMPFFASLTQGLDSTQQAIQRWNPSSLEVSLDKMANHAPGIAALASATLALGAQVGPLGKMLTTLGISANPVVAALVGLAAASPEVRSALTDLLAAGKPLIPVVGDLAMVLSGTLNSALPVVADGVKLLASVLEPIVRIFAAIPTPVIAGAAAFLAMHAASKALSGPLSAVTMLLEQFGQRAAVQAALGQTTAGMGALSAASMSARGAVTGLGNALKVAFLSNPIGIALTVVAVAIGAWAAANAAAQQKVEDHKNRVAGLKETLNETTGALTEATEAQTKANLAETRASELADEMGIKYRDIEQAILGNADAQERVSAGMTKHWEENAVTLKESDDALNSWSASAVNARNRNSELSEILEEQKAAIEDAIRAKQDAIQADREAAAAMTDAARSNQRFNDALQVARDITQDAETRVRALKQALDELKGGAISAEEAQIQLTRTTAALADGLGRADEAGNSLWLSVLNGAGAIDVGNSAGADFAETMRRAETNMLDAARAASDKALADGDVAGAMAAATAVGQQHIETLQAELRAARATEEQIAGLTSTYLSVPEIVATLLTDNGSISEVDQAALALALQLEGVPDGKSIEVEDPGNPEVIKRLRDAGVAVEKIPGSKNIKITQTGADAVRNILAELTAPRTVSIHVATGAGGGGGITKADGGVVGHSGGRTVDMMSFANGGGFPTGIFPGGPPIIKFAEPETGWEAFISGRKGQEARNARIAMDALDRLGFPVIPVSALRGIPAFADGGFTGSRPTPPPQPVRPPATGARISVYGHRGMNVDELADAVLEKLEGRL